MIFGASPIPRTQHRDFRNRQVPGEVKAAAGGLHPSGCAAPKTKIFSGLQEFPVDSIAMVTPQCLQ